MRQIAATLSLLALIGVVPSCPARADDLLDAGTLVGAGLGGLVGNQFGHGTGKMAATGVGVVTGGFIGHKMEQNWNSSTPPAPSYGSGAPSPYSGQQSITYAPNYVAPPEPPVFIQAPPPVPYVPAQPTSVIVPQPLHRPVMVTSNDAAQPVATSLTPEAAPVGSCRPYSQRLTIGNHVEETYGTACKAADGSWKAVN